MIRLVRKPSLWTNFLGRLLFAAIFVGALVTFSFYAWRHLGQVPTFVVIVLALLDLLALGLLWDIVVRLWRTMAQREPVVEIDRRTMSYGEGAQIRVTEEHPQSVAEMTVRLVGECSVSSAVDVSQHRERAVSVTRCYEEELLRMSPSAGEPLSRVLKIQLPIAPPAEGVSWKIVVGSTLKQGGVMEHPFPIQVNE